MARKLWIDVPIFLLTPLAPLHAADAPLTFGDPRPQRYELTARASAIDPRARAHPEIDFVFEKNGKPADVENASVDTRVKPQGKLVVWLMGHNAPLFERVTVTACTPSGCITPTAGLRSSARNRRLRMTSSWAKSGSKRRPARISATW